LIETKLDILKRFFESAESCCDKRCKKYLISFEDARYINAKFTLLSKEQQDFLIFGELK